MKRILTPHRVCFAVGVILHGLARLHLRLRRGNTPVVGHSRRSAAGDPFFAGVGHLAGSRMRHNQIETGFAVSSVHFLGMMP